MGKNKLKRFEETKGFENVIQPEYENLLDDNVEIKGNWGKSLFNNDKPIVLELGCGKGEYSVGLARRNPDVNYVGVDIKGARLWRGAKDSNELGMKNVGFLRIRIDYINSCFAENEVDQIWCTFSDPQLGHRKSIKKRLTSPRFLSRYQKLLKDGGKVHLKTDDPVLYAYTLDVVKHNNLNLIHNIPDVYDGDYSDIVPQIVTYYESKWLKEGRTIRYVCFQLPKEKELQEPPINEEREGLK